MTRTSVQKLIEVTEQTWQCDFCDFKLVSQSRGFQRGMANCSVCKKDICNKHTTWFQEDQSSDYSDARVCPDCVERFTEAWEWAKEHAGRYEVLMDLVTKRLSDSASAVQEGAK